MNILINCKVAFFSAPTKRRNLCICILYKEMWKGGNERGKHWIKFLQNIKNSFAHFFSSPSWKGKISSICCLHGSELLVSENYVSFFQVCFLSVISPIHAIFDNEINNLNIPYHFDSAQKTFFNASHVSFLYQLLQCLPLWL